MAGLPLLKLASMFVKQLSKPISNRMKVEASRSQRFSDGCVAVGQAAHQIYSRLGILASGYKIVGVKPLPYEAALSEGITVISESIMYSIAGGIIIYEYARNEAKSAKKAEQAAEKEAIFRADLEEKFAGIIAMQNRLDERISNIEDYLKSSKATNQPVVQQGWKWFSWTSTTNSELPLTESSKDSYNNPGKEKDLAS